MSAPCVVGRLLADATRILAQAGVGEVVIQRTAPPRPLPPAGPPRVVRQRQLTSGVSLLVAATLPAPREGDSHD